MFLKRSVFVILLMVLTAFFFINASHGSGKKVVQNDPFLKDFMDDFRTVLNSNHVKPEELKRLRPIDIMVKLEPVIDAIQNINRKLWSMTPQYFYSLNKYERVALLINLYNLKVFAIALDYQGRESNIQSPRYYETLPPETMYR